MKYFTLVKSPLPHWVSCGRPRFQRQPEGSCTLFTTQLTWFTPNVWILGDCFITSNMLMYIFFIYFQCFKASLRPRVPVVQSFWYRKSTGDTFHQTVFCGFFHCGSHFIWCAQCVLPWLRAVCLLPYRGHEDKSMSKRLLFFIFIFFVCAYVLSGRHSHWRAAATTRGFAVFSCLHWNRGWIPESDLLHGLQPAVLFF